METIVDRIRALCRQNGTSITKIEVELGYANGTIGKWAKGKKPPPLEKVMAIAERLGCTASYLQTGETELSLSSAQKEKPPAQGGEPDPVKQELYEMIDKMSRGKLLLLLEKAEEIENF